MFIPVLLALAIFSPVFAATNFVSKIHDIDYGQNKDDEILLLMENGHVVKFHDDTELGMSRSEMNDMKGRTVSVDTDQERYITHLELHRPIEIDASSPSNETIQEFVPTTIANMSVAKSYFKEARYNPKDSQCFNRAMVWSYEWWRKHSLKSKKMMIYFTRNYIRRYNFEWWFHIAPLVNVMNEGTVVERMMDIKYSSGPLEIRKWTNLFMKNDAECRIITKYSDFADNPYTGECYLQRTNMYTYQPADLQMEEAWGYKKENFIMNEVRGAYLEAYDEEL